MVTSRLSAPPNWAEHRHRRTQILGRSLPQRRMHPVEVVAAQRRTGPHLHQQAKTFGISGEATFDYGVAFDRSRKVADGRVAGVHYLMKKNNITETHGTGSSKTPTRWKLTSTTAAPRPSPSTTRSSRPGQHQAGAGHVTVGERRDLRGADPHPELPGRIVIAGAGAIGIEFGYVLANYGVDVTIVEFLPRACPTRTPRSPRRSRSS